MRWWSWIRCEKDHSFVKTDTRKNICKSIKTSYNVWQDLKIFKETYIVKMFFLIKSLLESSVNIIFKNISTKILETEEVKIGIK